MELATHPDALYWAHECGWVAGTGHCRNRPCAGEFCSVPSATPRPGGSSAPAAGGERSNRLLVDRLSARPLCRRIEPIRLSAFARYLAGAAVSQMAPALVIKFLAGFSKQNG
jgi:hypothetical protein